MDPITNEILKIGIGETAKIIFKSILTKNWIEDLKNGRSIVEQLTSTKVHSDYIVKHVSRMMKMRTIHSSDIDIMLNDIYHPLSIVHASQSMKIEDGFVLSDNNITNIIGFAGQGKSTILRKILLEGIKNGNKIPFFLELRKIGKSGIEEALLKLIAELGINVNKGNLSSLLKSDSVLLLLDGFDEVSSDMRDEILDEILSLNRNYNLQIITTSRDGTEICAESGIVNYKVEKIKRSDIISILNKLSQSQEVEQDTLLQIVKLLKENVSLVETMNSPLLVTLFYICYPHLDSIPNSAIEFYSKLFTTLYFRHDKIKNFPRVRKSNITAPEAFEVFCAFCFKSLYDNSLDFTHHSMLEFTKQSLSLCGIEGCHPENMAYDFIDITCLIQRDGFDRYVFLHKSIQEYHAAEYVKSLSLEKKKVFMAAILDSIKKESKMSATAKYLYEIDKENTFNLICTPLCEEYGIDAFPEKNDAVVDYVYVNSIKDVELRLKRTPSELLASDDNENIDVGDSKLLAFSKYFTLIGPLGEFMKPISIFTKYYKGDMVSPFNDVLVDVLINLNYTKDIFDGSVVIHDKGSRFDSGDGPDGRLHVMASDVINKLGEEDSVKEKIKEVVEEVYKDAFLNNKSLIQRKDDALKKMLGF